MTYFDFSTLAKGVTGVVPNGERWHTNALQSPAKMANGDASLLIRASITTTVAQ